MLCCAGITGIIIILFYGLDYLALVRIYQTPYLQAPLQSLTFYSENTAHISIIHFIILLEAFKALLPICAAASVLFISSDKRVVNQMYVPLLITAYALVYIILLNSQSVWLLAAAASALFVMAIVCAAGSYKKWCS